MKKTYEVKGDNVLAPHIVFQTRDSPRRVRVWCFSFFGIWVFQTELFFPHRMINMPSGVACNEVIRRFDASMRFSVQLMSAFRSFLKPLNLVLSPEKPEGTRKQLLKKKRPVHGLPALRVTGWKDRD